MPHFTSYDIVDWDKPFEKSQKPLESPHGFEVLIRVTAAGLCHSDLHIKKGFMDLGEQGQLRFSDRGLKLPRTLGHEIAGVVAAVGEDVTTVEVGQQVLVFPWVGCGTALPARKSVKVTALRCVSSVSCNQEDLPVTAWSSMRNSWLILKAWMPPRSCPMPVPESPSTTH